MIRLLITCPRGGGNLRSFHVVFVTVLSLIPQDKEPMGEFCQLPSMFISIIHLRPGELATGWVWVLNTVDPL